MNQRVVPTKQVETTDLVRGNWIWSYRFGGMTRCCREARYARIVTVTDPSGFFVEQGTDISCAPGAMRPDLVWRLQPASTYIPLHHYPCIQPLESTAHASDTTCRGFQLELHTTT